MEDTMINFRTSTTWKHVLSVFLPMEPDNPQKASRYSVGLDNWGFAGTIFPEALKEQVLLLKLLHWCCSCFKLYKWCQIVQCITFSKTLQDSTHTLDFSSFEIISSIKRETAKVSWQSCIPPLPSPLQAKLLHFYMTRINFSPILIEKFWTHQKILVILNEIPLTG